MRIVYNTRKVMLNSTFIFLLIYVIFKIIDIIDKEVGSS